MNAQAHYIRLYKAADEILRQPDNPCQIRKENGKITCTASRANRAPHTVLCCIGCKHLGPEGCTVMSLGCKLGWCYVTGSAIDGMKVSDHPMFEKIAALRKEAQELGLPALSGRRSYREAFEHGY